MRKKRIIIISILILFSLLFYFRANITTIVMVKFLMNDQIDRFNIELTHYQLQSDFQYENTKKLSSSNISLIAPWMDYENSKDQKYRTIHTFTSGKSISFWNSENSNLLEKFKSDSNENKIKTLKKIVGEEAMNDPFLFEKSVYNSTANDVKFFIPRTEAAKLLMFLPIKSLSMFQTYINYFTNDKIRGFQYDVPAKNKATVIYFFDNEDNNYEIIISGDVSQNEIDFIISSIKLKEQISKQ